MASLDLTAADAVLKQLYTYGRCNEIVYPTNKTFALLAKNDNYGGRNYPIPLRFGHGQGRSAIFSTAQSNATASKYEDFLMTVGENYGVATITGKTIACTRNDKMAFVDALTNEIDGVMKSVARDTNRNIFRTHTGAIGVVSATSTVYVTLTNNEDAHSFEVNMELSATVDLTNLRTGTATVTSVARNATSNHLTTDSNWTSQITSFAAGDYLLQEGDLNAKLYGFQSWIPSSTPSASESYFGVDRSIDSRLYGIYHDGSSEASIEDALLSGQSIAAVNGGMPDLCILNNKNYRQLIQSLGTKVDYDNTLTAMDKKGKSAAIGFRSVLIEGDEGPIQVVSDRDCPVNESFILQRDSWQFLSAGGFPIILNEDGLRIKRQATSDGYEVRTGGYPQLCCDFPGANARVALPTS